MSVNLPPVPNSPIGENHAWREWFTRLRAVSSNVVSTAVSTSSSIFSSLNFTGSNITSITTRNHNDLTALQGGTITDRQHLTTAQVNVLGGTGSVSPYVTPPASTGAAGTAPIKLTSGTLLTAPESGALEYSNNHWYITDGGRQAIVSSGTPITATTTVANTVAVTTLYTYTIAANELHGDEVISFKTSGIYSNASAADDFNIQFQLNGVTTHTVARTGGNVTNQGWIATFELTTRTVGAAGTFMDYAHFTDGITNVVSGSTAVTTINTTVANTFVVAVQWANAKAGNTFSCNQGRLMYEH